jgi:cytochrome c-type biogenesis protein CcmH
MTPRCLLTAALLLFALGLPGAQARDALPLAQDPVLEQRMVALTSELRCLVCQNESLAASQADLAKDLREQVRDMMRKGMTDQQIVAYLVARYGNFVRYRPPLDAETLPLWGAPALLVAIGLLALLLHLRRRGRGTEAPLDEAELERARQLLARTGDQE